MRLRYASWVLSRDAAGTEVLASTDDEAYVLRGKASTRVLDGEPIEAVLGKPAPPAAAASSWVCLSDVPGSEHAWRTAAELEALLGREAVAGAGRRYVLVTEQIGALVELLCARPAGAELTPVLLYGVRALVGPVLRSGRRPCGRCYAARLTAAMPGLGERLRRAHVLVPTLEPAEAFGACRALFEVPAPAAPPDRGLLIDFGSGSIAPQRVIPLSVCSCADELAPQPIASLVGEGLGLAFGLSALDDAGAFQMIVAQPAPDDPVLHEATGGCALDPAVAQARALGELVERRASMVAAERSVERAHAELEAGAVELEALWDFADEQYVADEFPFVRLDARTPVRWLPGRRLVTGAETWLPGALVSLDPRFGSPCLRVQSSTGTCAERSPDASVEGALLELVERDLAVRSLMTDALLRVDAERFAPGEVVAARGLGLETQLVVCATELPVCVAVAKVRHAASGRWSLGLACKRDPARAFAHAVEEAVQMIHRHAALHGERSEGEPARPDAEPSWDRLPEADPRCPPLCCFDLRPLIARYDPVACDLTNHESRAVGMWVTAVWSSVAVDLPRPGRPLPLRRWGSTLGRDLQARAHVLARVLA